MNRQHAMDSACDFEVIYLSVVSNIDYFYFVRNKYWYCEKFLSLLRELLSQLQYYEDGLKVLYAEADRFDFNSTSGNGFKSFCLIFERCFAECYNFCKRLRAAHSSMFFRASSYLKEAESLVSVLSGLKPGLNFISKMLADNPDSHLLMLDKTFTAEDLIMECANISQLGFYGQHQGFYYCASMKRILQGVGVIVATFSDLYQSSGGPWYKAALTIVNGMKYIINPELRAEQIVDVAQNSSVEFLKAFWSLSEVELMKRCSRILLFFSRLEKMQLPCWVSPKLKVREEIFVPAASITLNVDQSDEFVVIPIPTSHIPVAPVRCLLLSTAHRDGQMLKEKSKPSTPKSKSLLFHCHGGGFISQTPECHEIYLRQWAHDLNIPIISVDYSLSPKAPFPRALEEVLLAYAWVLSNPDKLGWTGETIFFAGDSAGGNILMSVVLKAISLKIRLPDLVLCAYTPLILDMVPSPSRLLCWIDPLLPLGFMISCLDAYCGAMLADGSEYSEEDPNKAGRRSRKISSISEIFDSSMNFLKQCQLIEVDASEIPDNETDSTFYNSDELGENSSSNDYVNDFSKLYSDSEKEDSNECSSYSKEFSLLDLPNDILFDIGAKCQKALDVGIGKISEAFISSYFYQKVVSPFVPNIGFPYQSKRKCEDPNKSQILQKIKNLKIVSKNPFMSPLLASDDVLKHMPPVHFVSLNFDPCLDDSIAFSKRLKSLNCKVSIDVLDGLPHGFLAFLPFSQEAHDGSNLLVRRLKEAMKLC